MDDRQAEITRLLRAGAPSAEEVLPPVYEELRDIARQRMRRDRRHFYAAAAEAMRRVLIDHARGARSLKRGGGGEPVTLGAGELGGELDPARFLALEDALEKLAREDERAAEVTRLRFFACGC